MIAKGAVITVLLLGATACATTTGAAPEPSTRAPSTGAPVDPPAEAGARGGGDLAAMADALRPAPVRPWSSAAAYRHFLEGSVALEDGAYGRAERELAEAVLHDPESAQLHLALARARYHAGKLTSAREAVARAARLDPGLTEAHRLLARIHLATGAKAEAEAALGRAIDSAPDQPEAYVDLAALLLEEERVDEALRIYEVLEGRESREGAPWKALGLDLERAGHLKGARLAFHRAREAVPEDAAAAEHEGRVCQALRDRACAIRAYDDAVVLAEERFPLLVSVARLHGELGQDADARAAEEKLLAGDPGSADTLRQVALSAAERGELELALSRLQRARALAPKRLDLSFFEGYLREMRGEHALALGAFARATADPVYGAEARLARASLLGDLGRDEEALAELRLLGRGRTPPLEAHTLEIEVLARLGDLEGLEGAVARVPAALTHDVRVLTARATALLTLKRPEEALRLLRAELRLRPRDQNLQYLLATVLLQQQRREEALTLMQAVSRADPDRADALNFLAYTWAEKGERLEEAEALARRALELEPNNGYILDTLGWVLLARQRPGEAVEALTRAVRLLPVEAEVLEHLAEAHWQAGQESRARKLFRHLLGLPGLEDSRRERVETRLRQLKAP
ncbi:MAG: tetratricopeptide repeat protein [Deltaproteobacteria bacterium]|nr:tetratricopeptide repeat protein [Deltaproteobacteria bacterium]